MRATAATLGLGWAALNFVASFFMVTSAFVAPTPAKEGLPAQAVLLLGGVAIEAMAVALAWQCLRILGGR